MALKNAILLKEANPKGQVTIVQRDVMAVGKLYEDYYRRALQLGVKFVRYDKAKPPQVQGTDGKAEKVRVYHMLMGKEIELSADLVLLTTPLVPAEDNPSLSQKMKIPLGTDGFFLEAHQKLRPVEFPADGIFVAGCARYPAEIPECIGQGLAAAAKAAIPMARGQVVSDAFVSEVDPSLCSACGRCVMVCPFGAVDWAEVRTSDGRKEERRQGQSCGMQRLRPLHGFVPERRHSSSRIYGRTDFRHDRKPTLDGATICISRKSDNAWSFIRTS